MQVRLHISNIISRLEFLVVDQTEKSPLLAMAWEIQMMALSFYANARVKERKKKRKGFMFS